MTNNFIFIFINIIRSKIKNNIIKITISIILLLIITIGVSFAYFTANIEGEEEVTTITTTGGMMNIVYNGGAKINIANIIPSNNSVVNKTFTVTGNNTTELDMFYRINLVVEVNTFSNDTLKYKLISSNLNCEGEEIPAITEYKNILSGSSEKF